MTYGLVGYHFGSREALIHEAAITATQEAIDGADLVPGTGNIDDFASTLSKLLAAEADAQVFQYELAFEARRVGPLLEHVQDLYRQYFEATSNALTEFGIAHDSALARMVFATLDGIVLQQLIFDRPEETDEAVAALQDVLRLLGRSRDESDTPARSAPKTD